MAGRPPPDWAVPWGQGSGVGNPQFSGSPGVGLGMQLHPVKKIPNRIQEME